MRARIFSGGSWVADGVAFGVGDRGEVELCRMRGGRNSSLRRAIVVRDMAPFGVRVAGHRKQMRWGLMEGVTVGNFERAAPEPWLDSP